MTRRLIENCGNSNIVRRGVEWLSGRTANLGCRTAPSADQGGGNVMREIGKTIHASGLQASSNFPIDFPDRLSRSTFPIDFAAQQPFFAAQQRF